MLNKLVAAELQVAEDQSLGSDRFLCIREKTAVWGGNEEFISSGRLDDQQCVFGILAENPFPPERGYICLLYTSPLPPGQTAA